MSTLTIEEAKNLSNPTEVPLSANEYEIDFFGFSIRDMDSGHDPNEPHDLLTMNRRIPYHFGPEFFKFKTIGVSVDFKVGSKPVKNFIMVERHYFKNQLIKSFDMEFPFCMPNSSNSFELIYDLPQLPQETIDDMIQSPWETKSDSFFFVDGKLTMHTKADYSYAPLQ